MSVNDFVGFGGLTEYVGFGSLVKGFDAIVASPHDYHVNEAERQSLGARHATKAAHSDAMSAGDKMRAHSNAHKAHHDAMMAHYSAADSATSQKKHDHHVDAAERHEQSAQHHSDAAAAIHKTKPFQAQKSLRSDDMDFNDFFKSETKCGECGQDLEKSHAPKGTVAKDNEHGPKHAGPKGSGFVDHKRGKGGNKHKKNETEKSESQELTFQKAFPVTDSFRAVEYVSDDGQVFSSMDQLQLK